MPQINANEASKLLEEFLRSVQQVHATGEAVKETSYYGKIETFLNEVGKTLSPRVLCVVNTKNRGAGIPDGGFFTPDQYGRKGDADQLSTAGKKLSGGQLPARGVMEAKSPGEDTSTTIASSQVAKYLARYGQVLVTNLREFVLVTGDGEGPAIEVERYTLAKSEAEFWALKPTTVGEQKGEGLVQYLRRALTQNAPLATPEDVAERLAAYAHEAKERVTTAQLPALSGLRTALETGLGLKFEGKKGDAFFRSTLVQTLFYGVFSAWVLWSREQDKIAEAGGKPEKVFDWRTADYYLRVPVIQAIYEQVSSASRLKSLDLVEPLTWAGEALNRVNRSTFFEKFDDELAVQYFYEPFLAAFDPDLRKQLGVWFTPPEIVRYMVERVDRALRDELHIADGLADPNVVVLDPCCGTGAYLTEVLRYIAKIHADKGDTLTSADEVKKAATKRVFGFEILPASYVIAHLQLGLLLQTLGAPLLDEVPTSDGSDTINERAGVYLTNALTGWEPLETPKDQLALEFPELQAERDAAGRVKRQEPILVIIGNPPYNAYAGTSPDEEQDLVEPYKTFLNTPENKGGWGIKKFNLDELYVRFLRIAERRIANSARGGVVCYISNYSYIKEASFVVLRERFLREFDSLWFDSLNGDSRATGKLTPEGNPDPSVFSTKYNKAGIRVGTAIGLMVRRPQKERVQAEVEAEKRSEALSSIVRYRQFWGIDKRTELLASLQSPDFANSYETVIPQRDNRLSFRPAQVAPEYKTWPRPIDLCAIEPYNGPVERRAFALISMQREPLAIRIAAYFDKETTNEQIKTLYPALMMTGNRIVGPEARAKISGEHSYDANNIVRYPFKPFDARWCYLENLRPLFSEPSPRLLALRTIPGNAFFLSRDTADKRDEGAPFYFSHLVCDYDFISGHARHFPLFYRPIILKEKKSSRKNKANEQTISMDVFADDMLQVATTTDAAPSANLSERARDYLRGFGYTDTEIDGDVNVAGLIWWHTLAVGLAPAYLSENADGIRDGWPRVLLPAARDMLRESAQVGVRAATLLNTEVPVAGVTTGTLDPALLPIAQLTRTDGKPGIEPRDTILALTVGWGSMNDGTVMPGRGRAIERAYTSAELAAIQASAEAASIPADELLGLLGETTFDVSLNTTTYWANVPANVWEFIIGGYQVLKKWLSYRERNLLGRALMPDEANEFSRTARRLAALIMLQPTLNANYVRAKANAYQWPNAGANVADTGSAEGINETLIS